MGEIKLFEKKEFGAVRIVIRNGNPWFVAKNVCECLELGNVTEALRGLDDDEKVQLETNIINPEVGGRGTLLISEAGLYSLILRSRKPEAKQRSALILLKRMRKPPFLDRFGGFALSRGCPDPELIAVSAGSFNEANVLEPHRR